MASETKELPTVAPSPKKAKTAAKPKKPKTAPSHPKVSEMVNSAIVALKERGGSSLQAIKKYIASANKVDVEKLTPYIKRYLRSAVATGILVQTKGKGATGSFRMKAGPEKAKPTKKSPTAKPVKKPKTAAQKPKEKKAVKSKMAKKAKVVKPKAPKPKKAKKTPIKKAPSKKVAKK